MCNLLPPALTVLEKGREVIVPSPPLAPHAEDFRKLDHWEHTMERMEPFAHTSRCPWADPNLITYDRNCLPGLWAKGSGTGWNETERGDRATRHKMKTDFQGQDKGSGETL